MIKNGFHAGLWHSDPSGYDAGYKRYGVYADTEAMAARREARVQRQKELINEFHLPLICFTMNIPGAYKLSPLIETVFSYGLEALISEFSPNCVYTETIREITGCEALIVTDADACAVKERTISLENSLSAGRLCDMDVIDINVQKLSRGSPRKCILCDKPAAYCAGSRAHALPELQRAVETILIRAVCEYISGAAADALIKEVRLTPKPGLVDKSNSGANSDMDISLFEKSVETLEPYFYKFPEYCLNNLKNGFNHEFITKEKISDKSAVGAFSDEFIKGLRAIGVEAEEAMLKRTGGVNTHRGAIYSLGLIVSSYAICSLGCNPSPASPQYQPGGAPKAFAENRLEELLFTASILAKRLAGNTETALNGENTNGMQIFHEIRKMRKCSEVSGAAAEAAAGFPTALYALKLFHKTEELRMDCSPWIYALLGIMARLPDKNVVRRGGKAGAEFVKKQADALVKRKTGPSLEEILAFDTALINRNINCGGCADMLAAAMLLERINKTLTTAELL